MEGGLTREVVLHKRWSLKRGMDWSQNEADCASYDDTFPVFVNSLAPGKFD